jgi:hypothetical protein
MLWILIASCVGLAKAADIENNWKRIVCSFVGFFDDIVYGYPKSNPPFVGIRGFIKKVDTISSSITTFLNSIPLDL